MTLKDNNINSKYMKIGEIAKLLGVHKDTIRRWESKRYLIVSRHPFNNYRIYSVEEVKRIISILGRQS